MEQYCGNCHKSLEEGDRYCRYCGTKRGEGAFLPVENDTYCVYAPPMTTRHICKSCGYTWTVQVLGMDRAMYCPMCRGKLESTVDRDWE